MTRGDTPALKQASRQGAEQLACRSLDDFAPLFRAQFDQRRPWWWTRRPALGAGGRLDLAPPDGTVCLATSSMGSLVEKLWDPGAADPADPHPQEVLRATLDRITLWEVRDPAAMADWDVSDLTDAHGGLPKEFSAADYHLTQRWADAIRAYATGRDGAVYWLRLDPAASRGLALFAQGSDDTEPGFSHDPFPLADGGRASALADWLPRSLFAVVDLPADEDMIAADTDAV